MPIELKFIHLLEEAAKNWCRFLYTLRGALGAGTELPQEVLAGWYWYLGAGMRGLVVQKLGKWTLLEAEATGSHCLSQVKKSRILTHKKMETNPFFLLLSFRLLRASFWESLTVSHWTKHICGFQGPSFNFTEQTIER